jgi:sulfide:quinone oxidoreductase
MKTEHLTPDLSVSSQLSPSDVSIIGAMGFKSIICNRPDGEALGQNLFEEIRTLAERMDIKTAYLPIQATGPTEKDKAEMEKLFGTLPRPILAYCETGARSTALLSEGIETGVLDNDT